MKAELSFMRRSQALRQVLVVTAVATVGIGSIVLLTIPHLKAKLEASGLEYGLAMSVLGLGSVVGGLMINHLSRRTTPRCWSALASSGCA
jgi:hypothetical protein